MVPTDLHWFRPSEFNHPEHMDTEFVRWLDTVRELAQVPFRLTSDARTPTENAAASGSSPRSLHLLGRAVDMKLPRSSAELWSLVAAVVLRTVPSWSLERELRRREDHPAAKGGVELELVHGPRDHHVHLGTNPRTHTHKLILADD